MTTEPLTLSPAILGFWTRCLRTTLNWSQEALAAAAGVDTRTIQRIESGKPSSINTRRSLARGLGYENPNIFEDPQFAMSVMDIINGAQGIRQKEFRKQHPDRVPVCVSRVTSGKGLGNLASAANATLFNCDDEISAEAKRQAACIFDFLRDLNDAYDELSFADRLSYDRELGIMLHDLEQLGVWVYSGLRNTKMVGENWVDKTPMSVTIGYLAIVPEGRSIEQLMAPKRLS
jgi:transcriptional regulator with XRE-family HTH domain